MSLLVATNDVCWRHLTGPYHPEAPERLDAVMAGFGRAGLDDALTLIEATEAPPDAITRVHPQALIDSLGTLCQEGGGAIDADTFVSPESATAARVAAGAGLNLIERLEAGEGDVGWSVVRPPGHHALANRQMGFCLINNVAVAARSLTDRGERVAIIDIDAHHGNGTQAIFDADADVLFVSLHQYPWYPYTGRIDEVGVGPGRGSTVNLPLPAGADGAVYLRAIDEVVAPVVERFAPTWLLVSAGFDGHRADPITELGLTSADYADMVARILPMAPAGRRLLFLEGGYDAQALAHCAGAVAAVTLGESYRPEPATSGGPGAEFIEVARHIHLDGGAGDL